MKRIRVFGGKRYYLHGWELTKRHARSRAKNLRKMGFYVRGIKGKDPATRTTAYFIYAREKR